MMTLFTKTNAAPAQPFSAKLRYEAEDTGAASADAKVIKQLQATFALPQNSYRINEALSVLPPLVAMQVPAIYEPLLAACPIGVTVPADTQMRIILGPVSSDVPAPLLGAQHGWLQGAAHRFVAALAAVWGALLSCLGQQKPAPKEALQNTPDQGPLRVQGASLVFSQPLKGTHNAIPSWLAHQRIKSIHLDPHGQGTLVGGVKLFNFLTVPGLQSGWLPGGKIIIPALDLTLAQTLAKGLSAAVTGKPGQVNVVEQQGELVFKIRRNPSAAAQMLGPQVQLGLQDLQLDVNANRLRMGSIIDATSPNAAGETQTTRADINVVVEGDLMAQPDAPSPFVARADLAILQRGSQGGFVSLIDKVELMATYGGGNSPLVVSNLSSPQANAHTAANLSHHASAYLGPMAGIMVSAAYASTVDAQLQVSFGDNNSSLMDNQGWDLVNARKATRTAGLYGVQPDAQLTKIQAPQSKSPGAMPGGWDADVAAVYGTSAAAGGEPVAPSDQAQVAAMDPLGVLMFPEELGERTKK